MRYKNPNPPQIKRIIPSECQGNGHPYTIQDRVISKEICKDSLFLKLGFMENCCIQFTPEIFYFNHNLCVELDTRRGEIASCACECCFELTLVITGIHDTAFQTFLAEYGEFKSIPVTNERFVTYPETYEIIEGDTLNRTNKYRDKIGLWHFYDDSTGRLVKKRFYNGKQSKYFEGYETIWGESYHPNGALRVKFDQDSSLIYSEEGILLKKRYFPTPDSMIEIQFYPNGSIKSKCFTQDEDIDLGPHEPDSCVYW